MSPRMGRTGGSSARAFGKGARVVVAAPAAPSGMSITNNSLYWSEPNVVASIALAWTNTDAAAQTRIYRGASLYATVNAGVTSYSLTETLGASLSYTAYHYKNAVQSLLGSSASDTAISTGTVYLPTGATTFATPPTWNNSNNRISCVAAGQGGEGGTGHTGNRGGTDMCSGGKSGAAAYTSNANLSGDYAVSVPGGGGGAVNCVNNYGGGAGGAATFGVLVSATGIYRTAGLGAYDGGGGGGGGGATQGANGDGSSGGAGGTGGTTQTSGVVYVGAGGAGGYGDGCATNGNAGEFPGGGGGGGGYDKWVDNNCGDCPNNGNGCQEQHWSCYGDNCAYRRSGGGGAAGTIIITWA